MQPQSLHVYVVPVEGEGDVVLAVFDCGGGGLFGCPRSGLLAFGSAVVRSVVGALAAVRAVAGIIFLGLVNQG